MPLGPSVSSDLRGPSCLRLSVIVHVLASTWTCHDKHCMSQTWPPCNFLSKTSANIYTSMLVLVLSSWHFMVMHHFSHLVHNDAIKQKRTVMDSLCSPCATLWKHVCARIRFQRNTNSRVDHSLTIRLCLWMFEHAELKVWSCPLTHLRSVNVGIVSRIYVRIVQVLLPPYHICILRRPPMVNLTQKCDPKFFVFSNKNVLKWYTFITFFTFAKLVFNLVISDIH